MCGIAGIMKIRGSGGIEPRTLRRMAGVLRHRGPDGYGIYMDDRVGLAHTRLSIVDLAGGAQPIRNEDGTIWVTFNGEIFNHLELRAELEGLGHRFYTRSDTEVIVHAYEQWGDAAWERFNGQFAIGLWDSREGALWLVRDRVGIVPLFYSASNEAVVFGSEVKALLAGGVRPSLDPAGIARVFSMWAAPAPWTVFQGVRSVEPGSAVCVRADGTLRKHSYWRPAMACERPGDGWSGSLEEAADELEGRLTRSIALRLRADVPVGAYLSGGLDSSVIAQLVRRVSGDALHTFSLRFDDPAFDESSAQRTMSTLLGTAHHDIVVGPGDISEAIPEVVWHCETPLLRTGPAPMFLLSGLVQRHGIKVVLTGEGADEFFAGYDLFKEDRVRRFWARRPESSMRPALLSRVHPYVVGAAHTGAMWEEYFRNGLSDTGAPFYSHRLRWEAAAWGLRFLVPEARAGVSEIGSDVERLLPRGWRGWPALSRAQGIEVATFLSAYLLSSQGDRVAMGHGVETRFPFLDPGVMDFSARLPSRMKMSGLRDKLVLRKVASGPGVNLPTEVSRRRKWPYRAPIAGALFGAQPPDYVRELLSARSLAESGVIDARVAGAFADRFVGKAGRMGEREEMALVGLLTLQLLHRSMIHGVASKIDDAEGRIEGVVPDVFEDRRSK